MRIASTVMVFGFMASALFVAGCSGGSGSAGDAVVAGVAGPGPGGPPPPPPGPPGPPPPPPPGAGLEATLRARLAADGIGTPTLRPAETSELVALGEALFFDKLLSGNRNISCATCHHPTAGTGDDLPLSLGEGASGTGAARSGALAETIPRNAPPLFHVGATGTDRLFWDGRVTRDEATGALQTPEPVLNGPTPTRTDLVEQLTTALAAQAMFPPTSHEEMRGDPGDNELADAANNEAVWAGIMARLVGTSSGAVGGVAEYRALFAAAYPAVTNTDDLTFAHAARAIAAYESATYAFFNAPLDRFLSGDDGAMTLAAKRGGLVFTGPGRCVRCHNGPLLSDFRFHSIAAPQLGPGKAGEGDDRGRILETGNTNDLYEFRTPPLRNVTETGPWTHAGAFTSLDRVVAHYRSPSNSLLNYDGAELPTLFRAQVDTDVTRNQARLSAISGILGAGGVALNPGQTADLIAFLEALTDPAATTPASVPATVPSGLPVAD